VETLSANAQRSTRRDKPPYTEAFHQ
jgi:hypothetical protein